MKSLISIFLLFLSILIIFNCSSDKSSNPDKPNFSELILGDWEVLSFIEGGTMVEIDPTEIYFSFLSDGTFISLDKKDDGSGEYKNECYEGGGNGGSYTITDTKITIICGTQFNPIMDYEFSNNNNTLTMKNSESHVSEIIAKRVDDAPGL